jgi:hypothetical protein
LTDEQLARTQDITNKLNRLLNQEARQGDLKVGHVIHAFATILSDRSKDGDHAMTMARDMAVAIAAQYKIRTEKTQ